VSEPISDAVVRAAEAARARTESLLLGRLEALERDNQRLRRYGTYMVVGMAILLGLVAALVFSTGKFGLPGSVAAEVVAHQFVLRDRAGALRGVWGIADDGSLRLVLQDSAGRPRVKLSLLSDGTGGLVFADTTGRSRAVFALLADQTGSVAFADESGKTRGVLGVSPDGAANVVFADRSGATRAGLGVDGQGQSTFTLADRAGAGVSERLTEPMVEEHADSAAAGATKPAKPAKPASMKRKP
jgi:hypothetical protein